ncbi:MAG: transglutaminase domain-containing protein [Planctomycetia bacterium]|nr:transglutaminase domain-containing protein [Planctomycetia bacterium]
MLPQPAWKWLAGIGLCFGLVLFVAGGAMFYPTTGAKSPTAYRLDIYPVRRIEAELVYHQKCPNLQAREWIVFVARPPELPSQSDVKLSVEPRGQPMVESSPLQRDLLLLRLPGDGARWQQFEVKVQVQARLHARRLLPREPRQPITPAVVLPVLERQRFLTAHGLCDHSSREFQRWLDARKLRRSPGESDVDFARRAFLAVTQNWKYDYRSGQERQASKLVTEQATDCGGMSLVFTAALRANGIPARVLAGRWAESSRPGELAGGVPFHQTHVKAEFFADGIGWVPVDPSSAVLHDRTKDGLRYFGNDPGDFLTLHLDTDLQVETVHFGPKTLPWLQGVAYWVTGAGNADRCVTSEKWEVRKLAP